MVSSVWNGAKGQFPYLSLSWSLARSACSSDVDSGLSSCSSRRRFSCSRLVMRSVDVFSLRAISATGNYEKIEICCNKESIEKHHACYETFSNITWIAQHLTTLILVCRTKAVLYSGLFMFTKMCVFGNHYGVPRIAAERTL